MKNLLLATLFSALLTHSHAAIIQFNLQGTAGFGLLAGNEPGSVTGGSGGEIGDGISYDDTANLLTLNVGWGSSQGFTDLTSASIAGHIHAPTANNNGNGFTETAGVLFGLTRSSSAATGGFFTTAPILLTGAQETDLLNGKYYINLHTANNAGGEMRGFLVPAAVPEPSTLALGAMGSGAALLFLRRKY